MDSSTVQTSGGSIRSANSCPKGRMSWTLLPAPTAASNFSSSASSFRALTLHGALTTAAFIPDPSMDALKCNRSPDWPSWRTIA